MKKIVAVLLSSILCATMLAGCNGPAKGGQTPSVSVYSFSGENDLLSISNGVIVLSDEEQTFYGGDLAVDQENFDGIAAYTETFYVLSGGGKNILLSNSVVDETGETIGVSGKTGKLSGGTVLTAGVDALPNCLWFELKTVDLDGAEHEYQLQLTVTEITDN